MLIKSYYTKTVPEGLRQVRDDLGDDAIILATETQADGTLKITAALEHASYSTKNKPPSTADPNQGSMFTTESDIFEMILSAFEFHKVPAEIGDHILNVTAHYDTSDPLLSLASALNASLSFNPIKISPLAKKPIMLVGPPGAGKTITTAKLAARHILEQKPAVVITMDTLRAAGIHQLKTYTDLMRIELKVANSPRELYGIINNQDPATPTYIDTWGVRPFDQRETDNLRAFIDAANAEPILTLAAGGDQMESIDIARAFRAIKVRRFLATKFDMTRHLGSIIAIADGAELSFTEAGVSPHIAEGLDPITPIYLANTILKNQMPMQEAA